MSKKEQYESKTEEILKPITEQFGVEIYDVEYVKEGSDYYLRAYIDKPEGVNIIDCEQVSRALSDVLDEKVDCIMAMTKGYLAANMRDFSYLFKYLMDARGGQIDFMTEDENDVEDTSGFYIDTIKNDDDQKGALKEMVEQLVSLYPQEYEDWKNKLETAMQKLEEGSDGNG